MSVLLEYHVPLCPLKHTSTLTKAICCFRNYKQFAFVLFRFSKLNTEKIVTDLQYLNTNHALYNAVIKAQKDGRSISEEAQRAAHSLRIDFEKGGIHLGAGTYPLIL